ncbi:hypothetical protein LINPERPRIM_LOCUS37350 [Linum perenne]
MRVGSLSIRSDQGFRIRGLRPSEASSEIVWVILFELFVPMWATAPLLGPN